MSLGEVTIYDPSILPSTHIITSPSCKPSGCLINASEINSSKVSAFGITVTEVIDIAGKTFESILPLLSNDTTSCPKINNLPKILTSLGFSRLIITLPFKS